MTKGKIEAILNEKNKQLHQSVIFFNDQSLMCKKMWIIGLSGVFIYFINPIIKPSSNPILNYTPTLTILNRAFAAVIAITFLFWYLDAITWYFQRSNRFEIEKNYYRILNLNNSATTNFLEILHSDIPDSYIPMNRPKLLAALFNKSHILYFIVSHTFCLLLIQSHLLKDAIGMIISFILYVVIISSSTIWYNLDMSKRLKRIYKILTTVFTLVSIFILCTISFYFGFFNNKTLQGSMFSEERILFFMVSSYLFLSTAFFLYRINKMRPPEILYKRKKINLKNIVVLYSFRNNQITENDLILVNEILSKTKKYNTYIDIIDNKDNCLLPDKNFYSWTDIVDYEISQADFIIDLKDCEVCSEATRFERECIDRYHKKVIRKTVDDFMKIRLLDRKETSDKIKEWFDEYI